MPYFFGFLVWVYWYSILLLLCCNIPPRYDLKYFEIFRNNLAIWMFEYYNGIIITKDRGEGLCL